jgi:ubiquinone/menaquinone biosynthesis C-methylase UbiE
MGFYTDRILPQLIRLAMHDRHFAPYRERVASAATGRVLEIGIGSGENLAWYRAPVGEVIGIEPAPRLAAMARHAAEHSAVPARIIEAFAERIPLDDASIDTVVMTWTLCSVADPGAGLQEMRRVLKPEGRLLFAEHGLAPDDRVRKWQHRLTPLWKRLAGGCHLDREINAIIANAGFRIEHLETGYMRGPRPMTFMYEGSASPQ